MKKKLWMIPLLTVSLLTSSCAADSTIGYTKLEDSQYLEIYLPESTVSYYMDDPSIEYSTCVTIVMCLLKRLLIELLMKNKNFG